MPLHKLSLESLGLLDDGKSAITFERHISRAAADCEDRPGEAKTRKVTLEIEMRPIANDDGSCNEVKAIVKIKSSLPTHQTREYSLRLSRTKSGSILAFSEDSPSDVNQASLFEEDDS